MNKNELIDFINNNITDFHNNRLSSLKKLRLADVLKRKNPYLFKAKNIQTSGELVKNIVDAYLSSQEETLFGEFLEKLAIYVCKETIGGYKSGIEGIDLEFEKDNVRYIITIKSGPNWGNSGQIAKMKDCFRTAKKILRTQNSNMQIVSINGCCYGVDNKPDKGDYFKYCGQRFWQFISGDDEFYLDIIEPLGYKAKQRNDDFYKEYSKVLNQFTRTFSIDFCKEDGSIDWEKIVKLNSQMKITNP
ncbi:MAG: cytosolic protein [Clostridia bacterium]|nr:cytosolic protein [Clostridia bacterium]